MILLRNRLVVGVIKNIIKTVFTVVLKIFQFFNLQFSLLIALIGCVLYITGTFDQNPVVLLVFQLLLIVSIVYAIVGTIKKVLGIEKKNKNSKGVQIVKPEQKESTENQQDEQKEQPIVSQSLEKEQKPMYFRVKNHPDYIMAEYLDRVELFKKTETGLRKIRTDYK